MGSDSKQGVLIMNTPTLPRIETLTARALVRLVLGQQFTHRDFQNEYDLCSLVIPLP